MHAFVECNESELGQILKQQGYGKTKNGYTKQCKGGRLHLSTENPNGRLIIVLHYDKFKGNQNKKYHHATHWKHPYVKKEMKDILRQLEEN